MGRSGDWGRDGDGHRPLSASPFTERSEKPQCHPRPGCSFFLGNCLEKGGCQPCHPKTRPNCMAASLRAPLGPWQRVTLLLAPCRACLSDFHPDHCSGLDQSSKAQPTLWGGGGRVERAAHSGGQPGRREGTPALSITASITSRFLPCFCFLSSFFFRFDHAMMHVDLSSPTRDQTHGSSES